VFLLYVAQSRQSARLFLQSSESAPQPQEMVSTPFGSGGGVDVTRKVTLRSRKNQLKVTLVSQTDI